MRFTRIVVLLILLMGISSPVLAYDYVVKSGDTLFKIGLAHNMSYENLKKANGLTSDYIEPGYIINIPNKTYKVQKGDSLAGICKKFGVSIAEVKRVNGLKSECFNPGTVLIIPTKPVTPSRSGVTYATAEEIDLLARAVYSEARGEPYSGQVAIAAVILNRVKSPEFPNTIKGVIFQPWAFTAINDGQFWLTPNATAYKAVRDALNGYDPSKKAIFYWNPVTATNKWVWTRPIHLQLGKHVFAT
ncbi:N-acetylmuramoyl-L-alanine amidase [Desulfonispora thiosulfatigenes DSM 11270]|uniref:N-acetylmuramoyl-L-alanine amidase n=1 Tax=Desulfonispora thiosulfatigenes DSM 11270 TaxID=656914 RepID=A0A1W1V1H3_DESTI|nr:cell wall hydrolase [Desulfonispora thiosulfatigenes]SMB86841.1 N-acetylmuramoyl-L-alanine amidase [Desulfonispora thiosulfatigenes DSM 11270]